MELSLTAIIPKRPVSNVQLGRIVAALQGWQTASLRRVTKYPRQKPTTRYRRTGEYGRRWTMPPPAIEGSALVARIGSNLSYASFVGGFTSQDPKQVKSARDVGWASSETVAREEFAKRRAAIVAAVLGK